jgi:hypothetical protein
MADRCGIDYQRTETDFVGFGLHSLGNGSNRTKPATQVITDIQLHFLVYATVLNYPRYIDYPTLDRQFYIRLHVYILVQKHELFEHE